MNVPLIILLHCLWAKSSNRTRGQFECDGTWLCFCFDFVRAHALCDCRSIVCWRRWRGGGGEGRRVGCSFKIGRPRSKGCKDFGRRRTGGEGSWKLDNFHGRHMCTVPYVCVTLSSWIFKVLCIAGKKLSQFFLLTFNISTILLVSALNSIGSPQGLKGSL